jgi:hypothetical protein
MKLQDLHPYDSAIVGLNNIYFIDYKGNFHINAPFILVPDKTISTGNTFVLIYSPNNKNKKVHLVGLLDAYYADGVIFLIIRDIASQETVTIGQQIECTGDRYRWILIDFDFLVEELNTEIIKSYCGSCKNGKNKSVTGSNHKTFNDDMLEFEF